MNIDNVYLCDIYRLDDISYNDINVKVDLSNGFNLDNFLRIKREVSFVKKALVYFSVMQGGFIDLETKEWYRFGYPSAKGELFVDVHKDKVYGKTLMDSKRKHFTKKKILKKYAEYKTNDKIM